MIKFDTESVTYGLEQRWPTFLARGIPFLLLAIILVLKPGLSFAEDDQQGVYVGFGLSSSSLQPDTTSTNFVVTDDSSNGVQLLLGYRIHRYWQAEIGYARLGSAELGLASGAGAGSVDYNQFTLGGLWLPFAPDHNQDFRLEPFVQLGISDLDIDSVSGLNSDDGISGFVGIGAEARWNNGFALRLHYVNRAEDIDSFMLSFIGYIGE